MATTKGHIAPTQAYTLVCQGCGANFILPPQELTIICPYCGSAYVLKSQTLRNLIQPSALIPLAVSELQAQQALRVWLQSRHLRMPVQIAKGVGVYLPFWDFDIGGQIGWRYQVEVQRQWVEETGQDTVYLTDILAAATKRLCQACLPVAQSYDLKALVDYDPRFLSNWPAETYQIEVGDASLYARESALAIEKQRAQQKVPAAAKNLVFDSSSMLVDSFRLVLLPLWMTCFSLIEGRKSDVVINGQTAQVFGEWD
jgi:DNA-directed RNA polymerase subunit RPC12/RpoP